MMTTFLMFGKYSSEAIKGISGARTVEANNLIKKNGGEVISQYALLGENDLLFIVNFPSVDDVIRSSVALNKLTGISFNSVPAITVEQFDKVTA
jgi:uncharacterized protein with GYD domain